MGSLQQEEADELVRTAIDAGINFIDTANVYSEGLSEQITGQALRNLGIAREDVIIAAKFFGPMGRSEHAWHVTLAYVLQPGGKPQAPAGTISIFTRSHGFDRRRFGARPAGRCARHRPRSATRRVADAFAEPIEPGLDRWPERRAQHPRAACLGLGADRTDGQGTGPSSGPGEPPPGT